MPSAHRPPICRRAFLGLGAGVFLSQRGFGQVDEAIRLGRRWLEDNLDPDFIRSVRDLDASQVDDLVGEIVRRFQGEYVLDVASLEEVIKVALPLLEGHAETRPFASWLRARADYIDVARWLRDALPRTEPRPGEPAPPQRIPTPEQERRAWQGQFEKRPQPKGASVWVPKLKPLFRSQGVPQALVWLAELESSFDPAARSPVGAVGLFQLMPRTAGDLGLKLQPKDERLVPEKNARAAAGYLRRLYGQFKDWPLSLAAYNAGPGRVKELLTLRRARSFDAIAPSLPAETQMYVPKFEAMLKRREGAGLPSLAAPVPV